MPHYGQCPKKFASRREAVVNTYRRLTGNDSLPRDRQYWTLCGPMGNRQTGLQPTCELSHMVSEGLIKPWQFRGVERLHRVHESNEAAVRKDFKRRPPKLCHGDLAQVMGRALARDELQPAIVNVDTEHEPERAIEVMARVLDITSHVDGPVMASCGMILNNRGNRLYNWDQVGHMLQHHRLTPFLESVGWQLTPDAFKYAGTGKSGIHMGILIWFRGARAIRLTG